MKRRCGALPLKREKAAYNGAVVISRYQENKVSVKKTPISEFHNLMAVSNIVLRASIDGGPPFVVRPGSDRDRSTPADTVLWRYMPKDFFFDLLDTQSLFFTRLTYYHSIDPFEGSLPYAVSKLHESIVLAKGGDVDEFLQAREEVVKKFLRVVLVNSWHERSYESRSMWDRYGKAKEAVAIATTFQCLRESVPEHVDVGHIDYMALQDLRWAS